MYIGIDIGGTNIRVASSRTIANPQIEDTIRFLNSPVYADNMRSIIEAIHTLAPNVEGIGIGIPGRLNQEKTLITHSRTIRQWIDMPVVETLSKEFNCPIVMNNDPYCAALSEALVALTKKDFFFIIYGTGIGAARVSYTNNKPHIQTFSNEEHADYLHPWQKDCGGRWIAQKYAKSASDLSEQEWAIIMKKFYTHLLYLIQALQPPCLVFGGGIGVKQWPRLQTVFTKLKSEHPEYKDMEIRLAHYGEDGGLYGTFGLISSSNVLNS
jgi:predicted NBD/HSP70 family sugar kinase